MIRERDGRTLPNAFSSEAIATNFIRNHVEKGTEIMADEANSWNPLHACYTVKRINHQLAYRTAEACTNNAESFFSRGSPPG